MIKVRFAPSPTGYLHIGGARTALFNWLYARHTGGKFVLRIEDTDRERSTKESELEILESMKWLGLDWDEGPGKSADDSMYYQTKRLDVYKRHAQKLMDEDKAYRCFCTKDELDAERKKAEVEKRAFRYDGRCGKISKEESDKIAASGKPYTIRIRVPHEGETTVKDLIRGDVVVQNATLDDMIIIRADGMPIYNFVVVVDDVEMGITDVIRGEDHLSNTPKQIHIYTALGFAIPRFAHIPLILGRDKSKLSKRHGEVSVLKYRESGFLADAMVNYLAFLGWAPEGNEDVLSREELISKFTIERIHKSGAMFDNEKLMWMNGIYIRKMDVNELTRLCIPFLVKAGLIKEEETLTRYDYLKKVVAAQQEKIRTLAEIAPLSTYFFGSDAQMSADAKKTWDKHEGHRQKALEVFLHALNSAGSDDKAALEAKLKTEMEAAAILPKVYMHVIRVAISGSTIGPGLFDLVAILGKERCVERVKKLL